MPNRIIISLVLLLIGTTAQAQDRAPAISYTRDIQPIFTEKCVACHACYDSACQLNLGSGEGAGRGASKMPVYDGESLKDTDPRAKSYQEYRDYAGVDEGMSGISTRFAFKILSKVFNYDSTEVAANPVHLMYVLERQIEREQFPAELETKYTGYIKEYLSPRYA